MNPTLWFDNQDLTSSFLNTAVPTLTVDVSVSISFVPCIDTFTAEQFVTIGSATFAAAPTVVTLPDTPTTIFFALEYPDATLTDLYTDGNVAVLVSWLAESLFIVRVTRGKALIMVSPSRTLHLKGVESLIFQR
jgi:hypothetical protein